MAAQFWNADLPDLDNEGRTGIYQKMNRVLTAFHDVDIDDVGLSDYGKQGNYFEHQICWPRQYKTAEMEAITEMDHLMEELDAPLLLLVSDEGSFVALPVDRGHLVSSL
jgi:aminoglycoside phosphotransferase (APT) family kinase protein